MDRKGPDGWRLIHGHVYGGGWDNAAHLIIEGPQLEVAEYLDGEWVGHPRGAAIKAELEERFPGWTVTGVEKP